MTNHNMARLSAELAYHEQVAARFFVRNRESSTYRIKLRDGLLLDDGTHYKKGSYLSEGTAMTFVAAVIERQPASERDAAMASIIFLGKTTTYNSLIIGDPGQISFHSHGKCPLRSLVHISAGAV